MNFKTELNSISAVMEQSETIAASVAEVSGRIHSILGRLEKSRRNQDGGGIVDKDTEAGLLDRIGANNHSAIIRLNALNEALNELERIVG